MKKVQREEPIRTEPTYEQIAQRAYDLFLERGATHGHDVDDWLRAEREVNVASKEMT